METIFRKVSIKERQPEKHGWYMIFLSNVEGVHDKLEWIGWWNNDGMEIRHVTYWLEEYKLPNNEEIVQWSNSLSDEDIKNGLTATGNNIAVHQRCNGARYIIKKIKQI